MSVQSSNASALEASGILVSRVRHRWLYVLLTSALLSACSQTGEWDEDVRLSSGEILSVHRSQRWTTTQPMGEGKSYIHEEATLEIQSSGMKAPWRGSYEFLMVVDKDSSSNEFFLVSTPGPCWKWVELGRPSPPYIEYRLRNGVWQRAVWSGVAAGRPPNVWVMPVPSGLKKHMTEIDIAWQARLPDRLKRIAESGKLPNC
jgi:hypothetical protein